MDKRQMEKENSGTDECYWRAKCQQAEYNQKLPTCFMRQRVFTEVKTCKAETINSIKNICFFTIR